MTERDRDLVRLEYKLDLLAQDIRQYQQLVSSTMSGLEARVSRLEERIGPEEVLTKEDIRQIVVESLPTPTWKLLGAILAVPTGVLGLIQLLVNLLRG